ncbi:MAG TPA: ATP-binding protein, partial [Burkholderiales bacterium]|nr:ATP-binding protein [Burkholderiales bacterium]
MHGSDLIEAIRRRRGVPASAGRALRRRIVAAGALLIGAIGASAGFSIWHSYQRTVEDADRELANLTSVLAEHTARTFQQIDLILRQAGAWSRAVDMRASDAATLHEHLKQQIAGVPQIKSIEIDDEDGAPLTSSRALPASEASAAGIPYFTVQRDDAARGLYIGEPFRAPGDGKWVLGVSRRLHGAGGDIRGIVNSTADVEYFEHFYEALKLGHGSAVTLFRGDGMLLARFPGSDAPIGKRFDLIPPLLAGQAHGGVHAYRMKSPVDGKDKLIAMRVVPGFPLAVGVLRDARVVLSGWLNQAIAVGLITLSLSLTVALLIAQLVRRLAQLEVADESLRLSEQRYALAMEGSNEGHLDWDIASDRLFQSPKMRELHFDHDALPVGTHAEWIERAAIHPDDKLALQNAMRAHLAGDTSYVDIEYRVHDRDGNWRWLLARGSCRRHDDGTPYRFAGSVIDVTERKRAEEDKHALELQLRQSQKMEAMGTLAGGIAHDFNNILSAILGYGEMTYNALPKGSATRRYMHNVLAAGARAKALVARILAFSRSGVGEHVPVRMAEVVREAFELLRATLPPNIELKADVRREDATVTGDPSQLHQVVMNLCTNAVQSMPGGGKLDVVLDVVEVAADTMLSSGRIRAGGYVRIEVSDTGHGMDAATVDRIFDPFFTTKDFGSGTGLGLSLVHGIVSDLGGGIGVNSAKDAGSRFAIYLPLAAAAGFTEEL